MIAVDTSTFVAYLEGEAAPDADALDRALAQNQVGLPPVVLTELLSDPGTRDEIEPVLARLPLLALTAGYWQRAAGARAKLLARKLKARVADALICQVCLDHGVPLLTRDRDFRHFAKHCGLQLL